MWSWKELFLISWTIQVSCGYFSHFKILFHYVGIHGCDLFEVGFQAFSVSTSSFEPWLTITRFPRPQKNNQGKWTICEDMTL